MNTILKAVALFVLSLSCAHAQLVSVSGALKTQFIPASNSNSQTVFHEVSFDIEEPIYCQGTMVDRLVTLNGPLDLGNQNAFLPLNYSILGDNVTLLYAASGLLLDVNALSLRMSEDVPACQVNVMRAQKQLDNLYAAPELVDELAVGVSDISYRQDYSYDSSSRREHYLNTLVLNVAEQFDCRGNETATALMQWRSKTTSTVSDGNILALDAIVIALSKNYLAVSPSNYQDDPSLGIQGCVVENLRSLSALEDPEQGNEFSGIPLEEVGDYCRANASEFGLYSSLELLSAQEEANALGFQDGIAACQSEPNTYGLFSGADVDYAFEQGVAECQGDPALCNLFAQTDLDAAQDLALQEGKQVCINDPSSCNLFTQIMLDERFQSGLNQGLEQGTAEGLEAGILQGIEQGIAQGVEQGVDQGIEACKLNPSSCQLFSQSAVDDAFANGLEDGLTDGINQCKINPESCGLFGQSEVDNQVADIREETMKRVLRELPRYQVYLSCAKNRNSLICQYRHYAKRYSAFGWWKHNKYKRSFY